jgi:glucose-6-phosphate 1-epimerase
MSHEPSPDALKERFGVTGRLSFERGQELNRARLRPDPARASVFPHGAHVTEFTPAGRHPILFVSEKALFRHDAAIRGGIPICFPWFGEKADEPDAPMHGLARYEAWQVTVAEATAEKARIVLETRLKDFALRYTVTVGRTLGLNLRITNEGDGPQSCEAALHSYFHVGDAQQVRITGLENTEYLDKTRQFARMGQRNAPVSFRGETDRIYLNTPAAQTLEDPALGRRITIHKSGAEATVVWNPGPDRCAAIADLADNDWQRFVCVETAAVSHHGLNLGPGRSHELTAEIALAPLT